MDGRDEQTTGCWSAERWRVEVTGRADPATTALDQRAEPLLTWSMTLLAAHKQARLRGLLATCERLEVDEGAPATVPARVVGWLDVRGPAAGLAELRTALTRTGQERARRDGTSLSVTTDPDDLRPHGG